ncbi:MAG: ornithine carbamoyltransferase [Candidatus Saganbacteria bacterium]|nr:ornithine carbamoyltransferase [Candidatus Saganbacteria bacterium]
MNNPDKARCKHLVSINDLSFQDIIDIYKLTGELKEYPNKKLLEERTIAMIFEKPSNRTRVSFEVGMYQLGGHAVSLSAGMVQVGKRESYADVARTLSRYVDLIALRTFEHKNVEELSRYASVPVINALSDAEHPCQALADIFTVMEKKGDVKGLKMVFIGDGNNVARSLALLCKKVDMDFILCCPKGYEMQGVDIEKDPVKAVKDADVIYTDVWASMGQEKETTKRTKDFAKYQVNKALLKNAKKDVLVMHCLPAHRGMEITDDVMDGSNSIVFDQAENRLHVQKAVLVKLIGENK